MASLFTTYLSYMWVYMFIFFLFIVNLLALSISLQCNKFYKKSLPFRIASALFAFCFGFVYITVNYYMYRISTKKEYCYFDNINIFPFF